MMKDTTKEITVQTGITIREIALMHQVIHHQKRNVSNDDLVKIAQALISHSMVNQMSKEGEVATFSLAIYAELFHLALQEYMRAVDDVVVDVPGLMQEHLSNIWNNLSDGKKNRLESLCVKLGTQYAQSMQQLDDYLHRTTEHFEDVDIETAINLIHEIQDTVYIRVEESRKEAGL
jgi:hypothetical protein